MIVKYLYQWDHKTEEGRAIEAKNQISRGYLCVLGERKEWSKPFPLEVYMPLHKHSDFPGGFYKIIDSREYLHISESEAYGILSSLLVENAIISFDYNAASQKLVVTFFEELHV